MGRKKKNIDNFEENRYGLFYNEESYDLDIEYGRSYLQEDIRHFIILYRVDIINTQVDDLYGQAEAEEKKYFPPVRLNVMVSSPTSEQSNYGDADGGIRREDIPNLTIKIFLKELEEKNTEINVGDYIEYNHNGTHTRFYEIENAENVFDSNKNTIAGFKPYIRRIIAVPVKDDVSQFLKGDDLV